MPSVSPASVQDLEDLLQRNEQRFYDRLDQQASVLEKTVDKLLQLQKELDEHLQRRLSAEQQLEKLKIEWESDRLQRRTAFETMQGQLRHELSEARLHVETLEAELAKSRTHLVELQEHRDHVWNQLHQCESDQSASALQVKHLQDELELCALQLMQAQDELAVNLELQRSLAAWNHMIQYGLKNQIKLVLKTLTLRAQDRMRWCLPIGLLRRSKRLALKMLHWAG